MNFLKRFFGVAIVILFSFWAVKHLFIPGFFPMHDDTQVARVFEMGKALRDGMLPVRWVADLAYGYGYPIFNFYAPLAYYVGGFFNLVGFDALAATKITMGLGIILSGIFMYLLAREFWGELGGVVAGLFYLYAPYHALDIYVRGDVAEFWAYAFLPLAFYGLWKLYKEQKWKFVALGALGYAGIILSHNLTAMMVTPFLIIVTLLYCYIAYRKKKLSTIYYLLSTIFLGLLVSAFYWIPALFEMHYTNVFSQIGQGADFRDHFVCIKQLWDSPWGFGGSAGGCIDGLSFKIGKLHILLSFTAFLLTTLFIARACPAERDESRAIWSDKRLSIIIFSFLGFVIATFFTLEISKPVWEAIPLMAFFQYPWRFLLLASFFSSFLAGCIPWFLQATIRKDSFHSLSYAAVAVLLFFLLYFNIRLFSPQTMLAKPALDYTSDFALRWTMSRISDEYMPKDFAKPRGETEIITEKILGVQPLLSYQEKTQYVKAEVQVSKKPKPFGLSIAYFPAWKLYIDGKSASFEVTQKGLIVVLPTGHHTIEVIFEQTPTEKMANILSVIGVGVLIAGIIYSYEKKER